MRCVIAAGWAVEDEPAKSLRDHVLRRAAARPNGSSTPWPRRAAPRMRWAATPGPRTSATAIPTGSSGASVGDAQHPTASLADEFGGIASAPALTLALESLAIKSRYQKASRETQRPKIRHLEERFVPLWGAHGCRGRVVRIGMGGDEGHGGSNRVVPQGARCQRRQCIDQGGRTAWQFARTPRVGDRATRAQGRRCRQPRAVDASPQRDQGRACDARRTDPVATVDRTPESLRLGVEAARAGRSDCRTAERRARGYRQHEGGITHAPKPSRGRRILRRCFTPR